MVKDRFSDMIIDTIFNHYEDNEIEESNNRNGIEKIYNDSIEQISNKLYGKLIDSSAIMLEENRLIRTEFESRLLRRWLKPLRFLEMLTVLSLETVEELYEELSSKDAKEYKSALFKALIQIHARAIQIPNEIQCLMRSGFADGAFSRWRTLYELSVLAYFLNGHDEELAQMYLDYKYIDNFNEMQEYREYIEKLGIVGLSEEEVLKNTEIRNMLIEKYGQGYEKSYGWTKNVLPKEKRNFKGVVEFIEMDHFKPYYRLACSFVHLGSRASENSLAVMNINGLLLTGAANYGLSISGQNVAVSLIQITMNLLAFKPNTERVAIVNVMQKLTNQLCESFESVQDEIEKQEEIETNQRYY